MWGGVVVCCQVVKWHCEFPQSVAAICKEKLLLMWHKAQATPACPLVRSKPNALWLKTPADQVVMGWHVAHCAEAVGKPAATWFGTEPPIVWVLRKSFRWQFAV